MKGGRAGLLASHLAQAQPATPLTPRQLDNLVAFARVAGGVRYFYPGRATSRVAWPAFYQRCLPGLLQAGSARALTNTLQSNFALVAPAVRFGGTPPPDQPAGALPGAYRWEHRSLGLLLGEPTGGTNGEMNFAGLGRCATLTWTGRRVLPPVGHSYQGQGIVPDVAVCPTLASLEKQQDAVLLCAVEYLLGR